MLIRTPTSSASARPCRGEQVLRRLKHAAASALALAGAAALLAGCGTGGSSATTSSTAPSTPSTTTTPTSQPGVVRPIDVVDAPVRIAQTAAGPVGYREVGTGSPLLLITGLSASIDDWQPIFVSTLAAHHTVVAFDNAGVGQTAALPSPLTITEMANQASALITTLGLGRTAVLGWSMGGMIAQALAVLHPDQVSRLILAATQAGTGTALPVPPAAAAAVVSPNPATVLSVLFPPSAAAAAQTYVLGILRYPGFYQAPAAVVADQAQAVQQWLAGQDPAGRQLAEIRIPTLVADGTVDRLDPVANARQLAATVPGATLLLYPGAGHAFLFQDLASFLAAVERFLG